MAPAFFALLEDEKESMIKKLKSKKLHDGSLHYESDCSCGWFKYGT